MKAHSHEQTDAQVATDLMQILETIKSHITTDSKAKGERKGGREVSEPLLEPLLTIWIFWNHSEDGLLWVWTRTEKAARKNEDEFNPYSSIFYILLLGPAVPLMRAWFLPVWIQVVHYLVENFLLWYWKKKKVEIEKAFQEF